MRAASDLLGRLLILPLASRFNHRYRGHRQLGRVARFVRYSRHPLLPSLRLLPGGGAPGSRTLPGRL